MPATSDQLRAARALLRLDQAELAQLAHISVATLRRIEAVDGGRVAASTVAEVQQALEQAGAEFIPDGVRRRRPAMPDPAELFEALRAISLRSAERLRGHEALVEADLYDNDGLPA